MNISNELPLISVAMATYNGAQFLEQQLDSILAQDYANFEIVVCDDNSQDATFDILNSERYSAEAAKKNVQLKVYRNQENLGYVKNFQKAIEKSDGQYIVFADQDDVWQSDKLSRQMLQLQKADSLAVYSDATLIDAKGNDLGISLWQSVANGRPPEFLSHKAFYLSNCVTGCTMMIDRKLLDTALPLPDGVPHDWWLAYHAAYQEKLSFVDDKLISYRQHDNNVHGLGRNLRNRRLRLYFRHKRDKLNLVSQLIKHSRSWSNSYHRLHVMHDFELTTPKGPSEELELLLKWIADKLRGASLSEYQGFFNSDSKVFQLFAPSKKMMESFDSGVRKIVRQTLISGSVAAIIVFFVIFASLYPLIALLSK